MEKIIEKMEIYHFINHFLPGAVFVAIFNKIYENDFLDSNIIIAIIEYYFIGLVLSRIGSVVFQPVLRKIKIIKHADYNNYIKASKEDEKIDILQREANQYRTYIATFAILAIIQSYICIVDNTFAASLILFIGLTILFIFAYKKQISFIVERVENYQ
ncbi:MAG: hypothetical protein IJJ82_08555 [Clostridia bacterium]|nr:hypothetical protein [Clostridia bacterium]